MIKRKFKNTIISILAVTLAGSSALTALAESTGTAGADTKTQSSAVLAKDESQPLTEAEDMAPDYSFFMEGTRTGESIKSMEDAAAVVADMTEEIGGNELTQFEPWRTITDTSGNNYYVFRQMYSGVTVSGGAVKVVTDKDGKMLGIVSSVEADLPDASAGEGIRAAEAESIVVSRLSDEGHENTLVLEEYTEKVILPVNLELDPDSTEEKEELRFVWAVFTNNDGGSITGGSELPYLAHYVTLEGEYLYSLPTIIPGDEAGSTGFNASYVFEFMEPATYTGNVTLADGSETEITVDVMRDTRTGMYYLGNLERRMVVADCYEFLYNNGKVILEASADNTGWDSNSLLSLYNYCRAWDYYKEIGWTGGDGLGTPIMILKDFCDKNHEPIDNAAYAGSYYGWQLFLSSSANSFAQCLDVLAHEFTHCVTGSVMTYNAYMNDYGAINEAISDIQGNICEMMMNATEDTTWVLGENVGEPFRNMGDPGKCNQPAYAWDLHYQPNVKIPTDTNDRGGVHSNSSLLNRVAYLLCEEGGMTLEEARSFWFAVDCSMVPGTDYAQLSTLLPWVLKNVGLEKYQPALEKAIKETRLDVKELPESLEDERSLVTLNLPDTETFADGNWMLMILSADPDTMKERVSNIINNEGDGKGAIDELTGTIMDRLPEIIFSGDIKNEIGVIISEWAAKYFKGILSYSTGAAGQDGRTIQMVCKPGYTIPVIFYLKFDPNQNLPTGIGAAIHICGRWIDPTGLLAEFADLPDAEDPNLTAEEQAKIDEAMNSLVDKVNSLMADITDPGKEIFYQIKDGEKGQINSDGLENVKILSDESVKEMFEAE